MSVAAQPLDDASQPLAAGRVVDHSGPAPDGVEVRGNEHRLFALAAQLGDDVPLPRVRDEAAADPDLRPGALHASQALRVRARDEGGRADRDMTLPRQNRD